MIYIIRHGKTIWNKEKKIAGRKDIPLCEEGIKQAYLLKDKLKDIDFDIVYSSPLKRAIQTAKIITDKELILDDRIIERNNGLLEGKLKYEIEQIDFNNPNEKRYDIENIVDFRKRINNFFDEITKYKDKNILVVTHAGVGIYARCYFEGEPNDNDYSKYKLDNCEFLEYENLCKKV